MFPLQQHDKHHVKNRNSLMGKERSKPNTKRHARALDHRRSVQGLPTFRMGRVPFLVVIDPSNGLDGQRTAVGFGDRYALLVAVCCGHHVLADRLGVQQTHGNAAGPHTLASGGMINRMCRRSAHADHTSRITTSTSSTCSSLPIHWTNSRSKMFRASAASYWAVLRSRSRNCWAFILRPSGPPNCE